MVEGCRAFQYPGHGCTGLHVSLTPSTPTQAATPSHTLPFKQAGLAPGQSTAPLQPFTHAGTHPFHRPPWPEPQNWSCCRARWWQAPSILSSAAFFQQSLTPSTVFSGNWCLTRLLRHIIYLFPLPPAQTLLSGELQLRQRQAGSYQDTGGRGRKADLSEAPPGTSSSPNLPVAMSTTQETRREGGDSSRRGQGAELRDRAHLSQQRRLKQATQFLHKDSADLLPLDSLKRLGTSKDLVRKPSPLP